MDELTEQELIDALRRAYHSIEEDAEAVARGKERMLRKVREIKRKEVRDE